MKRAFLILLFLIAASIIYAQQPPPTKLKDPDRVADVVIESPSSTDQSKIFTSVEQSPEFPGGQQAFARYLANNIKYPAKAVEERKQGKVFVNFVVKEDGSLSNVTILRSVSPDIDTEAMRVIKNSPKWKPGIQNGVPVRVQYTVPINFHLPEPAPGLSQPDSLKIFTSVEHEPEFPGAMQAFARYLANNIRYPAKAMEEKKQGKVFITFIVEKDGALSDVKVIRSVSPEIDAEALRVVRNSPKWKPGMQNGVPVRVYYTIPISFSLDQK